MSFEVKTEIAGLDPEAKRALIEIQTSIKRELAAQEARAARPKRRVTELHESNVIAKPGEVVRVLPGEEDITVYMPPPSPGNGGEDIIISVEGDGTAVGHVRVEPMNGTCENPGVTTLYNPGTYRYTSTGAQSESSNGSGGSWGGPAPTALEELPELAPQRLLGNNAVGSAAPTELTASQVLDWVDNTRGTIPFRGAAAWQGLDPGATELPLTSKGPGADPVYQQVVTAAIADLNVTTAKIADLNVTTGKLANDAVTNTKLANMAQSTVKGRAAGAGTGDPQDLSTADLSALVSKGWDDVLDEDPSSGANNPHVETGQRLTFGNSGALPASGQIRSSASFEANATGTITLTASDDVALTPTDDLLVNAGSSVSLTAATGVADLISTLGDVRVSAGDDVLINSAGGVSLYAGATPVTGVSDTDIVVNTDAGGIVLTAGHTANTNASAGDVLVNASSGVSICAGPTPVTAGMAAGDVGINADGGVVIQAGGTTDLDAAASDVTVMAAGGVSVNAGFASAVNAGAGDIDLNATSGIRIHAGATQETTASGVQVSSDTGIDLTPGTSIALAGSTRFTATITPTAIGSNQNNYGPTGWSTANVVRLSTSGGLGRDITGASAGSSGELKWLINLGPNTISLQHEHASSTAANRFLLTSGTTFGILTNGAVGILYDGTSSRWRALTPNLIT